jgi:hypothetical protein
MKTAAVIMITFLFSAMPWSVLAKNDQVKSPAPPQSLLDEMKPDKNGQFSIEGIHFTVLHKDEHWAPAYTRNLALEKDYPKITANSHEVSGIFKTGAGSYAFTQKLMRTGPDAVSYNAHLRGAPAKKTNMLCLSMSLSATDYRGQKIFFDNDAREVPWWSKGEHLYIMKKGVEKLSSVRIPLKHGGTLVIEGDVRPYLQDTRQYGAETCSLYLFFNPGKGSIKESGLDLTIRKIPTSSSSPVVYDTNVKPPKRVKSAPPKPQKFEPDTALISSMLSKGKTLMTIRPKGKNFFGTDGKQVNFWGMNLVSFYPEHALADKTADNLFSLGVNIVRPHHTLRASRDWCPSDCFSLLTYDGNSRTPNLKAWDHFDYLNAKLREKGIYLSITLHGTRSYLPDDVSILHVSDQDDEEWADAVDELNHWNWKKAFDPRKMLPVFDERCFLLNVEFSKYFLTHVNPYTGIAYGRDPQVLTVELINEFTSAYTLICGNTFPEYWTKKLNSMLKEYAKAHGVEPFELRKARTAEQKKCFAEFCNSLDESYDRRMQKVIRESGCEAPVLFSNLFRGDDNVRFRSKLDGVTENHGYYDPLVVKNQDFIEYLTKNALTDKPFIVGELNQSENHRIIEERKPVRSMLPLAIAAYGSFQDWSGIIWFAWLHGVFDLGSDGWGKKLSTREPNIGGIAEDAVILDHIRSAGIVFKNRYVNASTDPQTIFVDDSYYAGDYASIERGQTSYKSGWQFVHEFRKAYGPVPKGQFNAPWMKAPPLNPTISDTGQIVLNSERKQLSFSAPKAEGFSGYLDGKPISSLSVLNLPGDKGFATIIMVTLDDSPLIKSKKILLSRTYTDENGKESADGGNAVLKGLPKGKWKMKITHPAVMSANPQIIETDASGMLKLPASGWNECELEMQ